MCHGRGVKVFPNFLVFIDVDLASKFDDKLYQLRFFTSYIAGNLTVTPCLKVTLLESH